MNRLLCMLPRWLGGGHRRGKAHSLIRAQGTDQVTAKMFICPRCEATWTRKIKKAKAA